MQIDKQNGSWRVSGPITMETIHAVIGRRAGMASEGELTIDFGSVSEVDSAAISLVFEWLRQAQDSHTRIVFKNLPAPLMSLAALYGVADLIPQAGH